MTTELQFAPAAAAMRACVERYQKWIEQILERPLAETFTLHLETPLLHGLALELLASVPVETSLIERTRSARATIRAWKLPPGDSPRIRLQPGKDGGGDWAIEWRECPVALWLGDLAAPVVATFRTRTERTSNLVVPPIARDSKRVRVLRRLFEPQPHGKREQPCAGRFEVAGDELLDEPRVRSRFGGQGVQLDVPLRIRKSRRAGDGGFSGFGEARECGKELDERASGFRLVVDLDGRKCGEDVAQFLSVGGDPLQDDVRPNRGVAAL